MVLRAIEEYPIEVLEDAVVDLVKSRFVPTVAEICEACENRMQVMEPPVSGRLTQSQFDALMRQGDVVDADEEV